MTGDLANMSTAMSSERVCYVHCNFCNTILVVSVPCSNMLAIVTVRCEHCSNLLSVNLGALLHSLHLQNLQLHQKSSETLKESGSSSKRNRYNPLQDEHHEQPKMTSIRPPAKRQRVPSAYNKFIKEEIQRIKANNPEISHREAFSTAAKNWAHFPHIHLGLDLDSNKSNLDHHAI